VQLVIYRFPWPAAWEEDEKLLNALDYYESWLLERIEGYDNVTYLDTLYFWDQSHFADPLHVNHVGAERLSQALVPRIAPLFAD
jgi:hypothetical protein